MTQRFAELRIDDAGSGTVVAAEEPGDIIATVCGGNPLDGQWELSATMASDSAVVSWSGTLADELFAGHPANWMRRGAAALKQATDSIVQRLAEDGMRWCVRPHARHVLSDVPSCRQFMLDSAELPIGLALDPVSMLEPMMLDALDEHLPRMFQTLGAMTAMVFISDATLDEADECVVAATPGTGMLDAALLRRLLEESISDSVPIVTIGADMAAVRNWLRF